MTALTKGQQGTGQVSKQSRDPAPLASIGQRVLAIAALLFGIATIVAGGRVLLGADPGYIVFRPLLLYNSTMGLVYLAAGVMLWTNLSRGRRAAAKIFSLNLVVLVGIVALYRAGGGVAVDSLRAMTARTVIWLAFFLAAVWLTRASAARAVARPSRAAGRGS